MNSNKQIKPFGFPCPEIACRHPAIRRLEETVCKYANCVDEIEHFAKEIKASEELANPNLCWPGRIKDAHQDKGTLRHISDWFEECSLTFLSHYLGWSVCVNNVMHGRNQIKRAIADATDAMAEINQNPMVKPESALLRSKIIHAARFLQILDGVQTQIKISEKTLNLAKTIQTQVFKSLASLPFAESQKDSDTDFNTSRQIRLIQFPFSNTSDIPESVELLVKMEEVQAKIYRFEECRKELEMHRSLTVLQNSPFQMIHAIRDRSGESGCNTQKLESLIEVCDSRTIEFEDLRLTLSELALDLNLCLNRAQQQLFAAIHETLAWEKENKGFGLDLPGRVMINNCLVANARLKKLAALLKKGDDLINAPACLPGVEPLLVEEYARISTRFGR